jgi:molybdate transport system substrate-binding protein
VKVSIGLTIVIYLYILNNHILIIGIDDEVNDGIAMRIRHLIAVATMLGVAAWAPQALAADVIVLAAASLTNAFEVLAEQFQASHPNTKILMSFGASDVVAQQIINGAPADVFASADEKAMGKAVAANVVDASTQANFARNEVVLIVPADSKLAIGSVQDLTRANVTRVTLGNPASVPVGRYTKAALESMRVWESLRPKAIEAQNVRQALDYVARDEVDAGFVFSTDAAVMPTKVRVVQHLTSSIPVLYPIALTRRENRQPEARSFVDFVLSPQGQATLARFGFKQP